MSFQVSRGGNQNAKRTHYPLVDTRTGDQLTFIETGADTGGALLRVAWVWRRKGAPPFRHRHDVRPAGRHQELFELTFALANAGRLTPAPCSLTLPCCCVSGS